MSGTLDDGYGGTLARKCQEQMKREGASELAAPICSPKTIMKIPMTPPADWHLKFCHNLDQAIEFHRNNRNDPHGLGNAAVLILSEVREMFGLAVCGTELPKPKFSENDALCDPAHGDAGKPETL